MPRSRRSLLSAGTLKLRTCKLGKFGNIFLGIPPHFNLNSFPLTHFTAWPLFIFCFFLFSDNKKSAAQLYWHSACK